MNNVLVLVREKRIEEAEAELKRLQAEAGPHAQWHYARGLLMEAKGDVEEAIAAYESAIELDGNYLEAAFRLAFNLDLYGNEDRAISMYESLVAHTPTHVNALLNLGVIYEDRGEFAKALNCIERILADYPNHSRALLFRRDIESSMDMHYDEFQERSREKRDAIMDTQVSDFELSVRSRNCLKKMNINTLGDLLRISEAELLTYKNFGETSLSEIKAMLKLRGLRLGQLKEESKTAPRPPPPHQPALSLGLFSNVPHKYLSEVELSGRSRKCLTRLNLMTVAELVSKTEAELLAVKNFGQTSLNEIKQKLTEMGLALRKA